MRFDPGLAPDWLRIGTDILDGGTFNATFSLAGRTVPPHISSLSQSSATEGSSALTLTLTGSAFTAQSVVEVNGQHLVTTFVNADQLQAILPASLLADEGHFNLSVVDSAGGSSNLVPFTVTESVPVLKASAVQGQIFQQITVSGQVSDPALEDHKVRINWGDGTVQVIDLHVGTGGPFSASHTFKQPHHIHHETIVVTAVDDEGVASPSQSFDVIV
jgi:hypothetical protein